MEPSPWSSYGQQQHYPRLGDAAGGGSSPSELNLIRDTEYSSPPAHLFLPTAPHGLGGASSQELQSSFSPMGMLSPGYEGSILTSPFQQVPKGHFTNLSQGNSFFKSNKEEVNDLRGGFAHPPVGNSQPPGEPSNNSRGPFDNQTGQSWRHPVMPPTSCGPFGILPHEAVLSRGTDRNGDKSSQQAVRSSYDSTYNSVLPSPSRPPSSFLDPNVGPQSGTLTAQNDSQFYGESFYGCSKNFPMFNSTLSSSASSPTPSYSSYNMAGKDKADHEPYQANTSVIVSHLPNGQPAHPGVIGSASNNNICQNSPGSNLYMQNYQYHSPSSQPNMSPSVVQSPQHQSQDSRGITCSQNYNQIGSNQPSPSVLHSPYPAMNTPAPAATPAHATPPSSVGQAYCPIISDGSPHGMTSSVIPPSMCSSGNYKSVGGPSTQSPGKETSSQHGLSNDPLQLGSSHYISPVGMASSELHEDMVEMVRNSSGSSEVKSLLSPDITNLDSGMVSKHRSGPISMDKNMEMDMYNGQEMRMMAELDDHLNMGPKHDMMSQQNQIVSQGVMGHGVMGDYQAAPVRKRGRGRPRGSVNKRGRGRRRGRKPGPYCFEGERYVPSQMPPTPGVVRNTYPSRVGMARAPHNRVFTSHRSYSCDSKSIPGEQQQYMPVHEYHRPNDVYPSSLDMDSKVFNFDEHESDPDMTSSFSKFMSEARESAAAHNSSSSSSNPMNPSSCMKQKDPTSFLDVNLKDKPTPSGMEHCYRDMTQESKSKNYMSIEDDLGFLAELPAIDPEPPNADGSSSKTLTKEAGGFLQSFLSFIGGNSENTGTPQTSAQGQRGGTRGRRPRGSRGPRGGGAYRARGRGRGRGGNHRSWPPASRHQQANSNALYSGLNSNVQYSKGGGGSCKGEDKRMQKDCVVPNPEAPSFSSDEEDNTCVGIADSVEFVIRRLSEDEPPPKDLMAKVKSKSRDKNTESAKLEKYSQEPSQKQPKKVEWTPQSIAKYRKLGRFSQKIARVECHNPAELKTRISFQDVSSKSGHESNMESYEFNSGTNSEDPALAVRRTSMRRCKEEMMKKQQELKKKSESEAEEALSQPVVPGVPLYPTPDDDDSEGYDSDSDPAWTPHKPPDTTKVNSSHQPKEQNKRIARLGRGGGRGSRRHGLALRFTSTPGEGESRVIHILKGGRLYTRVQRKERSETKLSLLKHGVNKENRDNSSQAPVSNGEVQSAGKTEKPKPAPVDQDDITECFFRTGDFVVAKVDLDSPNPAIWQIEGKSLLQRFEAFEKDGRVLYRNASSYSAWNPSVKSKYLGVTVRLRYSSRAYTIAEYIGLSSTDNVEVNGETEESINAHPQRENFEVFLQTLISQVLDPNFIAEIIKEDDEYFLSHLKGIEELTKERKGNLLEPSWEQQLRNCAELYPCVNVTSCKNQEKCQLCPESVAVHIMQFHGQVYDQVTLSNQGIGSFQQAAAPHNNSFCVCGNCAQAVVLYHSLHHHKYNFFLKCRTRVTLERTEDSLKESHIILEHCLQDTNWINEMFSEMQEMWASCDKLR